MTARFNHLIIPALDAPASAAFYSRLLEADEVPAWGPFAHVLLDDGVLLQFARAPMPIEPLHFAFLVDDEHFDRARSALTDSGTDYWADPQRTLPADIREEGESRALYLLDPFGHLVELLTRPYY